MRIEDDIEDLCKRYKGLDKEHEVDVVLISDKPHTIYSNDEIELYRARMNCFGRNFNPNNVFVDEEKIPYAEIYFSDGLCGKYFRLAEKLGVERVYINSGDKSIIEKAKREGFQVKDRPLEEILNGLKLF